MGGGESLESSRPSAAGWIRSAVAQFERRLTLYATHLLGDVDRARDVVQETFLKLCAQDQNQLQQIEPHLAEWLFTVCRNAAMDVRRKDKHMSYLSDTRFDRSEGETPDPADTVEQRDDASKVFRMLEFLSENQQEVIRLKFQHGLSYQQISNVTGLSVTNVGYLIHTGLKLIRERLKDQQRPSQWRK
jgi:RNA polymerase sigma factor (sigma-70 family)